jgi:hypothetical protein
MMDSGGLLRLRLRLRVRACTAEHGVVKVVATNVAQHDRSHAAIVEADTSQEGADSSIAGRGAGCIKGR